MYKLWNRCMFCNPEYPDISWYAKYLHLNYITKNYHIEQKNPSRRCEHREGNTEKPNGKERGILPL